MKKVIAVVLSSMLLVSMGAFAAQKHKCAAGHKWDAAKKACVKAK